MSERNPTAIDHASRRGFKKPFCHGCLIVLRGIRHLQTRKTNFETTANQIKPMNMKNLILLISASLLSPWPIAATENLDAFGRAIEALKKRVTVLEEDNAKLKKQIDVERLIVRKELIVSDTGQPWEKGFEAKAIPRGIYARSLWEGPGGLWVRSRLIKAEIDDPFDDRFHALERDGSLRRAPGHISWNI